MGSRTVHRCVDATKLNSYKYYREMNNHTKLVVEACDANEFVSLWHTQFSEETELAQCVDECNYT